MRTELSEQGGGVQISAKDLSDLRVVSRMPFLYWYFSFGGVFFTICTLLQCWFRGQPGCAEIAITAVLSWAGAVPYAFFLRRLEGKQKIVYYIKKG